MREDPAANQLLDPRKVPEFARFAAYAPVRPVPGTPPKLLPGITAFRMHIVVPVVWFASILFFIIVGDGLGPWLPAAAAALCSWTVWWLRRVGNKEVDEFAQGYTTLIGLLGTTFPGFSPRIQRLYGVNGMVGWDFSGLWVLSPSGRVIKPPESLDVLRPGFYPSPHRERRLELWTGKEWAEVYRKAPRFFS